MLDLKSPSTAARIGRGSGLNDLLRRAMFPGLPPTQCVGGYVFFPWGTGPCFPIPCDPDFSLRTLPGGAGTQFVTKPGSSFAAAVAEIAGVSRTAAEKAVAKAAGMKVDELRKSTVVDVGRKIVHNTLAKSGLKHVKPSKDATVGEYFDALAKTVKDIDPARAIKDLAEQTGMHADELRRLPLSDLGDHLSPIDATPDASPSIMARTNVCISGNGQVRCGVVTGWLEGAVWGGFIGGAIGGGLGAAIGAVIGAIIGWLF